MLKHLLMILLAGIVVSTGCTSVGSEANPTLQGSPTPQSNTPTDTTEPFEPTLGLNAGIVPQTIFDSILADLLVVSAADSAEVTVVKNEAVTWSDGSLGCPQPDVMYTQALVEGYQVIFSIGDTLYDYHISDSGNFVLCDNAISTGPIEGTPTQ